MIKRLLLVLAVFAGVAGIARAADDTCLMFAARNIAKGGGNFYIYKSFSNEKLAIAKGDVLQYDVYLFKGNPQSGGGVDFDTNRANLRDSHSEDQNQIDAHNGREMKPAEGKWYHRKIPLDKLAGQETVRWNVVCEGDPAGTYVQFIDNVVVAHADGSRKVIYENGEPAKIDYVHKEGYSQHYVLKAVPRATIADGANLDSFVANELKRFDVVYKLEDLNAQIEVARTIADRTKDPHLTQHVTEASELVAKAEKDQSLDAEGLQAVVHQVHESLNHEHPEMRKYTGHLVGHAHIDFQWLWPWTETIQVCHDTFGQAVKFMNEFPGFKFSQSSSALYAATEENFPDIFKEMQKQVEAGNWEIVGGRVCEGDENMISPESHAMHFLYGQRYFRERFKGKDATVGWEPDTFGHTWQFPQILKLGGCKYFYFCRGGHGNPLFWWQGPDGTKVLAFEEPATGGWYNGDVTMNRFERLFKFADTTGSKDMLWVYGVGNHGGGPTRENIQAAIGFQKTPFLPNVKFSTAAAFFHQLEKYDLSKIPTVKTDMNTTSSAGFFGVFTTHSDMKRWNRDAEAVTESAEAIAAFASRYGYSYPGKEFRRNWEEITWNHHHDTLPGTSIHKSYEKSEAMYKRTIESSRKIGEEALKAIAAKVKSDADGVLVFNPVGWTRSGVIEYEGGNYEVSDLPAYGYRAIPRDQLKRSQVKGWRETGTIENDDYRVVVDPSRGVVTSIFDKQNNRECIADGGSGNRLEIHWEEPNGMSAWQIGKIAKVEPLVGPVKLQRGNDGTSITWERHFQSTTLRQSVLMHTKGPPIFQLTTEWKELGSGEKPSPFLKVAFDVRATEPKLNIQIPYGVIEKPKDNGEYGALKWADLAGADGGAAIINDCKHGYSAEKNTLRLSLIRSSYNPDPRPNDRPQTARWIFQPHTGDWKQADLIRESEAFNHPLWATQVRANPAGTLPAEMSFLSAGADDVIVTGVKKAEDDDDLVVRFYESAGKASHARIATPFEIGRALTVNFVEDKLAEEKEPTVELRPWEIRTLKLAAR
jgi:alpha-mannosidase